MKPLRLSDQNKIVLVHAARVSDAVDAGAMLLLLDGPANWETLRTLVGEENLIVAADREDDLEGANEAGIGVVVLDMPAAPVYEKITQAVLESVADDLIAPRSTVVAVYGGFEAGSIDTVSVLHLGEHLERLTARDLRRLETSVPLDTLKAVVDLAAEIGREGREGKPVGGLFVVGDARRVLGFSKPVGFDPVKGYSRKERNLTDSRVREGMKEIAQMDGAFVIAADGTVEAAARMIHPPVVDVSLTKGLGTRHWSAAAISKATKAISVTVSESTGTVRLFQDGEVVLRIEPFRRLMKWKDFEYEPRPSGEKSAG